MPYKKSYRKKKPYRKRRTIPKLKIARNIGIKPSTHFFKRRQAYQINLMDETTFPGNMAYTAEGDIYWNTAFALDELPSYTDFTNLFAQYKINAVKITLTPHINTASWGTAEAVQIRTMANQTGRSFQPTQTHPASKDQMLQIQALKTITLPKNNNNRAPAVIYNKVRQLNMVWRGITTTGYTSVKPRYISSNDATIPHEGVLMYINTLSGARLDGGATNVPFLNVELTYYISCKQVF